MSQWLLWSQGLAALYLVVGALIIDASLNWQSKVLFKVIPFCLGAPLALAVFANLMGWPI